MSLSSRQEAGQKGEPGNAVCWVLSQHPGAEEGRGGFGGEETANNQPACPFKEFDLEPGFALCSVLSRSL